MAHRFIEVHQTEFGLRWLLRRMKIHPNAYYNYRKNATATYQRQKTEILEEIRSTYHELGGVVGHRNMQIFLRRKGICLSKTTVHEYMNQVLGLRSICRQLPNKIQFCKERRGLYYKGGDDAFNYKKLQQY